MVYRFVAHGLRFDSDHDFLFLTRASRRQALTLPDFEIKVVALRSMHRAAGEEWQRVRKAGVDVVRGDVYIGLRFEDGLQVRLEGKAIAVAWPSRLSETRACHTLLHAVIPYCLAFRGHVMLHAGCVAVDEQAATLFVGPTGRGKSTLTAWMLKKGARLLGDDVVRIELRDNQAWVHPSYDSVSLLADSHERLFGDQGSAFVTARGRNKVRLRDLNTCAVTENAVLLNRIHVLLPGRLCSPVISIINPVFAVAHLMRANFIGPIGARRYNENGHLDRILALAARVTVAEVRFRKSWKFLPELASVLRS